MDDRSRWVMADELPQQPHEKFAGLAVSLDPNELAGSDIQRAGKKTLDVLARREDFLLLALQHPVGADFRVQMDVNLVFIHSHLIRGKPSDQLPDLANSPAFSAFRPRTADRRLGAAAPSL